MIVTFLDREGNYIHSCTDCEDVHEELAEGNFLTIKGIEYSITKVETRINGSVSRIVHLL